MDQNKLRLPSLLRIIAVDLIAGTTHGFSLN